MTVDPIPTQFSLWAVEPSSVWIIFNVEAFAFVSRNDDLKHETIKGDLITET